MSYQSTTAPAAPQVERFAGNLCNLTDPRFGASVVQVSDEFFAAAARMHEYDRLNELGPLTHLRLNMHPDGGIMRFRAFGLADHS